MKNKEPNPIPAKIRIIQNILGFIVGFIALSLWKGGMSGFFAFILSFSAIYVGVGVIYLREQEKKK